MTPDYPAAHSMDSMWFAVDKDGHIARFTTGESGAMPAFDGPEDMLDVIQAGLENLPDLGRDLIDPLGYQLPKTNRTAAPSVYPMESFPTVIFLTELGPLADAVASGQARVLPSTVGVAVVVPGVSETLAQQLNQSGLLLGSSGWFEDGEHPEGIGIYEYDHLAENWIAGPYGRQRIPRKPLHIDQVAPALRKLLRNCTLPKVSFATDRHIQPVEHTECASWEPGWLSTDGVIRPFEDRIDEFDESMGDVLDDLQNEYRIERPE